MLLNEMRSFISMSTCRDDSIWIFDVASYVAAQEGSNPYFIIIDVFCNFTLIEVIHFLKKKTEYVFLTK